MSPPSSPPPEHSSPPQHDGKPEQVSFLRVVGTVLSAFIGIRKRQSAEAAHQQIKPVHVIVAGIIGALVFIAILVTLVRFIIAR